MARLNTRPSHASSRRFASQTPAPNDSDEENRDPTRIRDKGKGRSRVEMPATNTSSTLPMPSSVPSDELGGQQQRKRKRVGVALTEEQEENAKFIKYYDPDQDTAERQETNRRSRALRREIQDNQSEYQKSDGELLLKGDLGRLNVNSKTIKNPGDAKQDSGSIIDLANAASKKAATLVLGDGSTGVDVDEFLSKCITFMRNGGPPNNQAPHHAPTSSRRQTQRHTHDDDDADDVDDTPDIPLDWASLGRNACLPYNIRPPVPTFLLGPLSVEKKQRTQTQRRARQSKDTNAREARPEALTKENLQQAEDSGVTAICTRIHARLGQHITAAEQLVRTAGFVEGEMETPEAQKFLRQVRLADNGWPRFQDYVINPWSLGQTVENIFYVAFLIKEGVVGVDFDSEGNPTLGTAQPRTLHEQRETRTEKHQAIFHLDWEIWEDLVKGYDIREPLIAHRDDPVEAVGATGWYN